MAGLRPCHLSAAQQTSSPFPSQVLSEAAPVIWLQPKTLDRFSPFPAYDCPVYRTAERKGVLATTGHNSNFLMFIRMPTDRPDHHWVYRGVCMLCSLSD